MADKDYKVRQVQTIFFILLLLANSQFVQLCPEICQCQETIVTCKSNTTSQLPDEIPRDTTSLKIEYNRYVDINGSLLTKLPFLTTLSLKAQFNKLEGDSFTNLQNLKKLKIDNTASHKSPIDHNVFKDFVKLEELDLDGFILDSSIKDGLRFPQTLRKLRIKFCRLEEVTKVSFESLDNLQHLYIQSCKLKNVETFAFADLQNLLTLNLQSNNLTRIEELTFSGLDNLQNLVLDDNEIEFIHEDTFNSTRNLQELHLGHNKLRSDPTVYTRHLVDIVRFNGGQNKWFEIKKYSLPDSLKYLDVSRTETFASDFDFSKMTKLKHLDLHGNHLADLTSHELDKLTLLEYLDMSDCSIQFNLHSIGLRNLKTLNLTHNPSFVVTNKTFNKLENLETLILKKIRLREIPDNFFESNRAMTHLTLSQCSLSTLPAGTFTTMNNLERLILSGNFITSLPKDIFHNLKNLKELDLGNNRLLNSYDKCNDVGFSVGLFEQCEKLEILTLRLNRLTYVNDDHLKGNRTSLLKLDVAENYLQSIQLHSKYPNLQALYLFGQTEIVNSTVVDISFKAVPVLKDLRLYDNKIDCTCGLKKLLTKLPLNDSIDHTSDKCEIPSWLKDVPLKELAEKSPCGEGICIDTMESSICRCPNNFYGSHCEQNKTSCKPNPCKHGSCSITNGLLKCICHENFTGKNCDVKVKCKDLFKKNDGGRVASTILLVAFGLFVLMIFGGE